MASILRITAALSVIVLIVIVLMMILMPEHMSDMGDTLKKALGVLAALAIGSIALSFLQKK